jgi:membrane protein DedA with SNARE-associated domain
MPTRTTATAASTTRNSYFASGASLSAVASGNPASIAATVTASTDAATAPSTYERHRPRWLALAALRALLAVVAVPLAPFLFREHAAVLVLLRPSKEVLLLAGFLVRHDDASLPVVLGAALPLLLGGVWVFFALGRAYEDCLDEDRGGLAGRLLPPERVSQLADAVRERGPKLVFLGRLAAFPSTLVAAAAGGSGMSTRAFLLADAAGALLSMALLMGAGYALGEAYEDAGPWLTTVGVLVLGAVVVVLGRALKRAGRRR